jgi:hypothetical protein
VDFSMNSVPSHSDWFPYHAVAIRLRSRVWLMLRPQNLRASSHRPYEELVRKTEILSVRKFYRFHSTTPIP